MISTWSNVTINATSSPTNIMTSSSQKITAYFVNETDCKHYDDIVERWFQFGTLHLVRVLITWFLFFFSLVGNSFVLWSLRNSRTKHFIVFHLALADLVYTLSVMPLDAVWNTTMQWFAGDVMCRMCQMMKQFGMYSSSFMVAVIGIDRVTGILSPLSIDAQRKRGFVMVVLAWITSFLCCVPAGAIFSVMAIETCEGIPLYQCVDFQVVTSRTVLGSYYFFTMLISFVLPCLCTIVSYSLIVCEIKNMKQRDRELWGRRDSLSSGPIKRAKRRTILVRTLVSLAFLICWGPYYGKGIYDWLIPSDHAPPAVMATIMYIMMYFNPVLHPIVFGVFMKEIRKSFVHLINRIRMICLKSENRRVGSNSRTSFASYTTGLIHAQSPPPGSSIRCPRAHSSTKPLIKPESRYHQREPHNRSLSNSESTF